MLTRTPKRRRVGVPHPTGRASGREVSTTFPRFDPARDREAKHRRADRVADAAVDGEIDVYEGEYAGREEAFEDGYGSGYEHGYTEGFLAGFDARPDWESASSGTVLG